jgi:MFS family permease
MVLITRVPSFGIRVLLSNGPISDVRCIPRLLFRHKRLSSCRAKHVLFSPPYHARSKLISLIKTRSSLFGRLIAGRIADRYGRLNTLMLIVAMAILFIFSILYPFGHTLPALYVFSSLYGLASGSFISLAPVCIRQISDTKEIGLRFGTCYALVSFAWVTSSLFFFFFRSKLTFL